MEWNTPISLIASGSGGMRLEKKRTLKSAKRERRLAYSNKRLCLKRSRENHLIKRVRTRVMQRLRKPLITKTVAFRVCSATGKAKEAYRNKAMKKPEI